MNGQFLRIGCIAWDDITKLSRELRSRWAFRGQSDGAWGLVSSLERAFQQFECPPEARRAAELEIFRQFQRSAHHHVREAPKPNDLIEWFALMQHHGAPTRLLDFTYSFYVAAFFASESLTDMSAIWGLNLSRLSRRLATSHADLPDPSRTGPGLTAHAYNELASSFVRADRVSPGLVPVEPERKNERLSIQQGLFLFPADITVPCEQNLADTFGIDPGEFSRKDGAFSYSRDELLRESCESSDMIKIEIPRSVQAEALAMLRSVNLTAATLFPGLDGFARSLRQYASLSAVSLDVYPPSRHSGIPPFRTVLPPSAAFPPTENPEIQSLQGPSGGN
ncbi:FRG domain-containing protein [Thalassobaculum sp.]|uniref:FRG domain-containing protein n=1 Tax=Thalassobaculum sp. TaxID=2022740 RepID=UPI0032EDE8B3